MLPSDSAVQQQAQSIIAEVCESVAKCSLSGSSAVFSRRVSEKVVVFALATRVGELDG
jgi:hypothetical protein